MTPDISFSVSSTVVGTLPKEHETVEVRVNFYSGSKIEHGLATPKAFLFYAHCTDQQGLNVLTDFNNEVLSRFGRTYLAESPRYVQNRLVEPYSSEYSRVPELGGWQEVSVTINGRTGLFFCPSKYASTLQASVRSWERAKHEPSWLFANLFVDGVYKGPEEFTGHLVLDERTPIKSLGRLRVVEGDLKVFGCEKADYLVRVCGSLTIKESKSIRGLPSLKESSDIHIMDCPVFTSVHKLLSNSAIHTRRSPILFTNSAKAVLVKVDDREFEWCRGEFIGLTERIKSYSLPELVNRLGTCGTAEKMYIEARLTGVIEDFLESPYEPELDSYKLP